MSDSDLILSNSPILGRSELALLNMIEGDLSASTRALYDPDSLRPDQREKLAARLGLKDTPFEETLNVAANPLVLIGLAMSLRWPMPTPGALAVFKGGVSSLKKTLPLFQWLSPMMKNLEGTPVYGTLQETTRRMVLNLRGFREGFAEKLVAIGDRAATEAAGDAATVYAYRLADPTSPAWRRTISNLRSKGKSRLADAILQEIPKLKNFGDPSTGRALAQAFDEGVYQPIWANHLSDPTTQRELLRPWLGRNGVKVPKSVVFERDAAPRLRWMTPEQRDELAFEQVRNSLALGGKTGKPTSRQAGKVMSRTTGRVLERNEELWLPNPEFLRRAGWGDDAIEGVIRGAVVDDMGQPLFHETNFYNVADSYMRSIAKSLALHKSLPGDTRTMMARMKEGLELVSNKDPGLAEDLVHTVYPMVMGERSWSQVQQGLSWATSKSVMRSWLEPQTVLGGILRKMPGGNAVVDKLNHWLTYDPSNTLPGIGQSLSGWMYTATLGAPNIVAPLVNHLQNLNVLQFVGAKHFGTGYSRATTEFLDYAKARFSGLPMEQAIEKAAPLFARYGLELDPVARTTGGDLLEDALQQAYGGPISGVQKWTRRIQDTLLSGFHHSEIFNRMIGFHSGRAHAQEFLPKQKLWHLVRTGTDVIPDTTNMEELASEYGMMTVFRTHFGSGPLQTPKGLLNWNPALKQFLTYPLRQAGFVAGELGRDPGAMGRALLTSGLLYGVAREGGLPDISRGLFFGGLPAPSEYGPFAPLPVMPPVLSLAGNLGMAAATGDAAPLKDAATLLVPGGVGLSRLLGSVSPAAGQALGRNYADYENRRPDGRIPIMRDGALVGYLSDAQVIAMGLGLNPPQLQREQEFVRYMSAHTKPITGMRRDMLHALQENDPIGALGVRQKFDTLYPGVEFPVRKTDIQALYMRTEVSRIERVLERMPAEVRPQFAAAVSGALGAGAQEFLGLESLERLQEPAHQRDDYRRRRRTELDIIINQGLHGVKYDERLKDQGVNRGQGSSLEL